MPKREKTNPYDYASLIKRPEEVRVPKNGVVVTYSEMDSFRQCPLKHQWAYKEGWSKPAQAGGALARGSLWHEVLEVHYRTLQAHYPEPAQRKRGTEQEARALELCARNVAPLLWDESGRQSEDQELITWMYEGHVEYWGADDEYRFLGVETSGRARLRHPETGRPTRFFYQFKIDLLVQNVETGRLLLWDHKSASDFTRENEMDIDDQFGLYTAFLKDMGVPVFGALKSEARTRRLKTKVAPLNERFRRTLTYRSDVELANLQRDLYYAAQAAYANRPETRLYSSPDPRQCGWKCDFLGVHLATRKGLEADQALRDFGFEQRETKHREYKDTEVPINGPEVLK